MPFVNLDCSEVEIYWTSNIPNDDLSVIRSNPKPLVLMLHAIMLSTEWLAGQLTDPFLSQSCYIIGFDGVTCGRTRCPSYTSRPLANRHDAWAEAAMMALFARELDLPPFHIFAEQVVAIKASERFAILFPNQLLSLTYVGVPPPVDEPWVQDAYMQACLSWIHAQDLETLEKSQAALLFLPFCTHTRAICLTEDELDRLMAHWQMYHHPAASARGVLGATLTVRTRQPLRSEELAMIHHPVHMIQGDSSPIHTAEAAYDLQAQLINARCAEVDIIRGGPDCVGVPARFAPAVNQSFATFLFSSRSENRRDPGPCTVDAADMRRALALNAKLEGKPTMNELDPENMWSFCRLPLDARKLIDNILIPEFTEAEKKGKSFLGPDGNPTRKYSERYGRPSNRSAHQIKRRRVAVVSRVTVRGLVWPFDS